MMKKKHQSKKRIGTAIDVSLSIPAKLGLQSLAREYEIGEDVLNLMNAYTYTAEEKRMIDIKNKQLSKYTGSAVYKWSMVLKSNVRLSERFIIKYQQVMGRKNHRAANKRLRNLYMKKKRNYHTTKSKNSINAIWSNISLNENLSESFMTQYGANIDWSIISVSQYISESLGQLFFDKIDWEQYFTWNDYANPDFLYFTREQMSWNIEQSSDDLATILPDFINEHALILFTCPEIYPPLHKRLLRDYPNLKLPPKNKYPQSMMRLIEKSVEEEMDKQKKLLNKLRLYS